MKKSVTGFMCMLIIFLVFSVCAQGPKEIHKTFQAKKLVHIEITSGDCTIKPGDQNEIKVDVYYDVRPEDAFEADILERNDEIKIKERWHGNASGKVTWTVTVPGETDIDFSAASGDLTLEGIRGVIEAGTASGDIRIRDSEGELEISTASGDINLAQVNGEIELSTASGDIRASEVNGQFDFSTASGDIRLKKAAGSLELSCASGDIEASALTLEQESSFSTASGDIDVKLAESLTYDLECSAASGDMVLDYNGNDIKGFFEFTTRKHGGRIKSPVDFDIEEEYERGGTTYIKKSFSIDGSQPRIILSTSSGNIELKK